MYDSLDADWHWYRFEYQSRGSTHAHGCAKLKNDPGICALVEKAWTLSEEGNDTDRIEDRLQILQDGEEATITALRYADWLVSTCNDAIPEDLSWSLPVPHPLII